METVYSEKEIIETAKKILSILNKKDKATILALRGDLGSGKTTLTKALGHELGITETITSPTFVIAKFYYTKHQEFKKLIHIDAYRIEDIHELEVLGWNSFISNNDNLIIIEWPEKIQELIDKEDDIEQLCIETIDFGIRKIKNYEK